MSELYPGNLKFKKKNKKEEQRMEMRNRQVERGRESTQIEGNDK